MPRKRKLTESERIEIAKACTKQQMQQSLQREPFPATLQALLVRQKITENGFVLSDFLSLYRWLTHGSHCVPLSGIP